MKTNGKISFTKVDLYEEEGKNFKIKTTVSLDDDCKNYICDWSVTAEIMVENEFGNYEEYMMGCCHEKIEEHCPLLAEFVPMHGCDHYGMPNVHNGRYFMEQGNRDAAIRCLRISHREYDKLSKAADDHMYFKYLLFKMGIAGRWQRGSRRLIKKLEALCGEKWVNPYDDKTERPIMRLDEDEKEEIEKRISEGYYSPSSVQERKEKKRREKLDMERRKVMDRYEERLSVIENEKKLMLYILDRGISVNNVIYDDKENLCKFNWNEYGDKIPYLEFAEFTSGIDYSKLPEGIKFKIKV